MITAERYHDISCGHRVHGHESKCAHLHGHNYRIHFACRAVLGSRGLDSVGRVIDFSEIKSKLCMWVEEKWDHKFLAWRDDPIMRQVAASSGEAKDSIVWTPFNPTAENMASYLLRVIGPTVLNDTGVELIEVRVEETRKCTATARLA